MLVGLCQLIGFFSIAAVMFASTVACAVLSLQLFFTIRLMTAGPTGFDKASHFYQDKRMWRWRERAIFGVKFSMVFMFVASGFLLCAKFNNDNVVWLQCRIFGFLSFDNGSCTKTLRQSYVDVVD